jgi:Tol biopolymer transport system component
LFFVRDDALLAQPLDLTTSHLTGAAIPVADFVGTNQADYSALVSVSASTLAFRTGSTRQMTELIWYDRSGRELGRVGEEGTWGGINLSPDGKRAASARSDARTGGTDVWTLDLERNVASHLTSDGSSNSDANWAADGSVIFFSTLRRAAPDIFRKNASGMGSEELIAESGRLSDVSRDGSYLLQLRNGLTAIPLKGSTPTNVLSGITGIDEVRFSPNMRWVAFNRNETGDFEAYVVSYPKADQRWQVSVGGGVQPRWRADGREIFYLSLDGTLMNVSVDDSSGLTLSRPTPLFRTSLRPNGFADQYDVTMDGKRFIVVRPVAESGPPPPISAVVNWVKTLSANP